MNRRVGPGGQGGLGELAMSLLILWLVLETGPRTVAQEMTRWDRVRRVSSWGAKKLGELAIYAEHRYNKARP